MAHGATWLMAAHGWGLLDNKISIYRRNFFSLYLPKGSSHPSKKKKLINCGVVGFTLQVGRDRQTGLQKYLIDEASIASVYGGFATK